MIHVTRLNHTTVVLNSQLIEYVDTTPDTVISLTTGEKLMVLESAEEIISRVVAYQQRIRIDDKDLRARTDAHGREQNG